MTSSGKPKQLFVKVQSSVNRTESLVCYVYIIAFVWTHPNLGVPVVQSHEFSRYRGDCRLAVPTGFIRGISARKLDSFRLD